MLIKDQLVLLTGTIKPSKDLNDYSWPISVDIRSKSYFNTICYYITNSCFKYIVFCENSLSDFEDYKKILQQLSIIYNKELEIIQYNGNHTLSSKLGYGYGEGECIDYAFDNSKLLSHVDSFRKVTGRYIYTNIDNIALKSEKYENLFFKNFYQVVGIFTGLFKVKKSVYKKYLYNIKNNINLSTNYERLYYDRLIDKKIDFGKIAEIPIRIPSTIYDKEEVDRRKIGLIGKFLFFIGQWNFSIPSFFIDKSLIILMNIKHFFQNKN